MLPSLVSAVFQRTDDIWFHMVSTTKQRKPKGRVVSGGFRNYKSTGVYYNVVKEA